MRPGKRHPESQYSMTSTAEENGLAHVWPSRFVATLKSTPSLLRKKQLFSHILFIRCAFYFNHSVSSLISMHSLQLSIFRLHQPRISIIFDSIQPSYARPISFLLTYLTDSYTFRSTHKIIFFFIHTLLLTTLFLTLSILVLLRLYFRHLISIS